MKHHRRAARRKGRAKVGRPRKAGNRKLSGDLRLVVDEGAPRLLAHRALAVNPALATRSADELAKRPEARDRRASYPLGVLLLWHEISSLQHYAGRRRSRPEGQLADRLDEPSVLVPLRCRQGGRGSGATVGTGVWGSVAMA